MTDRPISGAGWRLAWIPNLDDLRPHYDDSCVYYIVCNPLHMAYIGSAKQLVERMKHHFSELALKQHGNYKLQRAFNEYGVDNFKCGVAELCPVEDLAVREEFWIKRYPPEKLFNIQRDVKRSYPVLRISPTDALRIAVDNGYVLPDKPERGWIEWFIIRYDTLSLPYEHVMALEDGNYLCGKLWISNYA